MDESVAFLSEDRFAILVFLVELQLVCTVLWDLDGHFRYYSILLDCDLARCLGQVGSILIEKKTFKLQLYCDSADI